MSSATPPPGGAPPKAHRYAELDAVRGLSAFAIVALHAYENSRGPSSGYAYADNWLVQRLLLNLDFGVSVFFVVSGFVIFLPFAKAIIDGREHIGVKEFALRRFFRIVPLYYVVIFAVWNSRYYGGPGQIADLVRHLTFTQLYDNGKIFHTVGPAWSLAAEVHYYVFTALLVWVVPKAGREVGSRRRRTVLVAAGPAILALASIACKLCSYFIQGYSFVGPKHYTVYYSALARGDSYAFGMLLAIVVVVIGNWRPMRPWYPRLLTLAGLTAFALIVLVRRGSGDHTLLVGLLYNTWVGLCATLIIGAIAISACDWRTMRILRCGTLQLLGLVSYSLYLWHEPLMLALEKHNILVFKGEPAVWPLSCAALIVIGVAVGWASYRLIEIPGQRLRQLLRVRRPRVSHSLDRVDELQAGELQVRRGMPLAELPALQDEDGAAVELRAFARGRPMVAFIQPRHDHSALEAGCVAEARAFRESKFVFDALGVSVVGISTQPPAAQKAFRRREQLPFPMLSDPGSSFVTAAGVRAWRGEDGVSCPERVVLVIDRSGTIRDLLAHEIPAVARPGVAAARSEPLRS